MAPQNDERVHVPVLLTEVMAQLALRPGDDAIDCTFGAGGYSRAMLAAIAPDGKVLALDHDPAVRAASVDDRLLFVHGSFKDITAIAGTYGFHAPRAIVADLGFSSLQLGDSNRGFSFQHDGPLDMRFDPTSAHLTAAELLATLPTNELERIIREYGEERHARAIANAIGAQRKRHPLTTTGALADLIAQTLPRRGRIHPATRTFQALRIAVNDELGVLRSAIPQMLNLVVPGGCVAIVSFHSLEDRIVKQEFRAVVARGWGERITKKPIVPSAEELAANPRSRSAKLRVVQRYP
ncbi:MAG: 16S rRNA (cytosine(1402)-N(4))-methyltransferase RsmH [bacterium]|nr:16S rRNA (cytosine(1402)-N(4))-methyltransferase RsmH [bacterium]